MKREICIIMVIISVLSILSCKHFDLPTSIDEMCLPCKKKAVIPDENLMYAIRISSDNIHCDVCEEGLVLMDNIFIDRQINDYTGIEKLAGLKSVYFYNVTVSVNDIILISQYSNIQNISIEYCNINDKNITFTASSLTNCYLRYNNLDDITFISGLTSIKYLYIDVNKISDIAIIGNFNNLEELSMSNNLVSSIDSLQFLTDLCSISAGYNQISDISPLSGCANLQILILNHNNISDISCLAGLTKLYHLSISNNNISDISVLVTLADAGAFKNLEAGSVIDLQGNPLNATPDIDTYIPYLQSKGIIVYY